MNGEGGGGGGVRADSNPSRLKSVKTPICLPGHEKERGKRTVCSTLRQFFLLSERLG
jgi:hypothetical protein